MKGRLGAHWLVIIAAVGGLACWAADSEINDQEEHLSWLTEHACQCMDENPDAVLVCEYANEWQDSDGSDVMITSCTVVEVEKGNLKVGQKLQLKRMIEKPGKQQILAAEKENRGNLRFVFLDAKESWVQTGDGCEYDPTVATALRKKAAERHR